MIVTEEPRTVIRDLPEVQGVDADALIREARRRQHRRWLIVMAVVLAVTLGIGLALSASGGGTGKRPATKSAPGATLPAASTASNHNAADFPASVLAALANEGTVITPAAAQTTPVSASAALATAKSQDYAVPSTVPPLLATVKFFHSQYLAEQKHNLLWVVLGMPNTDVGNGPAGNTNPVTIPPGSFKVDLVDAITGEWVMGLQISANGLTLTAAG
jgi:hypothetical protein